MSGRSEFDIWRLLVKRKVLFEESALTVVISPPCLYRFARSQQPGEWVWILRRDWTIIWIVLSNIKRCFKKDRERDDDRFVIVVALYVGQICRQPMSVEDEPSWSAVSPTRHPLAHIPQESLRSLLNFFALNSPPTGILTGLKSNCM